MHATCRSLIRRAAVAACLLLTAALRARAQQPLAQAPAAPAFMSRYDFHLSAAALDSGDDRFTWDTHFGGEFDLVDYVKGRAIFWGDYQAVLGSEIRPFDPNQGNYNLAAGSSIRARGWELVGVLHHESRHLGDRVKRQAIAWNDLDLTVLKHAAIAGTTVDVRGTAGKVIAHALVDYSWVASADVVVRKPLNANAGLFGHLYGEAVGINPSLSTRSAQRGGRAEAGVRFAGPGGAFEFFGGGERIVDADAFEQLPRSWVFAGFRIVSR